MLEFVDAILGDVALGRERFDEDAHVRTYVEHHLLLLGEAANRVRRATQASMPDVPWAGLIGLRNVIVHGYDTLDSDRVWEIASSAIAPLRAQLFHALSHLPPDADAAQR